MRERILAADVDEAVLAAGRERGDRHRLDERERIALHQHAVLERAGLGLVGVADEVVRPRRLRRAPPPTCAGRERRAAAAEQLRRRPPRAITASGPSSSARAQRRVAAVRDVRVERLRVDARARSGAGAAGRARPAAGAAARSRGSWISCGSSPATVRSAAGARSHSPRHGLGCAPGRQSRPRACTRGRRRRACTSAGRSSSAISA